MYGWIHAKYPKRNYAPYYSDVLDGTSDQKYVVNSRTTNCDNAISDVGGIGIDRPVKDSSGNITGYKLFETQFRAGTYDGENYKYSGIMSQWGSKYWADQGNGYTFIVHWYYDWSAATNYDYAHFFYY